MACIESTVDVRFGGLLVRVWREENELRDWYDNSDVTHTADKYLREGARLSVVVKHVAELPRINAVQVINEGRGEGVVVYTVWP
jgi:hypothetical protein